MPFDLKAAFMAIESDLIEISRYIEFSEDNLCTYSLELSRFFVLIGSEVDIAIKDLCKRIVPGKRYERISDCKNVLFGDEYEKERDEFYSPQVFYWDNRIKVFMPEYDLTFRPWVDFNMESSPTWWSSYNGIKHDRMKRYVEANLENVLNASAGLFYILIMGRYIPESPLFWGGGANRHGGHRLFRLSAGDVDGKK